MPPRSTGGQVALSRVVPGGLWQVFPTTDPRSIRSRRSLSAVSLAIVSLLHRTGQREQFFFVSFVVELDRIIVELESPTLRDCRALSVAITQIPLVRVIAHFQWPDDSPLLGVVELQGRHGRFGAPRARTLSDESHAQYSSLCGLDY